MDKLIRASDILDEIGRANNDGVPIEEDFFSSVVKKMFVSFAKKLGFGKRTPYWTDPGFYDFQEYDQRIDQNGLPLLIGAQNLEGSLYGWILCGIKKVKKPTIPSDNPDEWDADFGGGFMGRPRRMSGGDSGGQTCYYIALVRYLPTAREDTMWFLYRGSGPKDATGSYNEYTDKEDCKSALHDLIHLAGQLGVKALKIQSEWKRMVVDRDSWEPYDPDEGKESQKPGIEILTNVRFDVDNPTAPFDKSIIADEFHGKRWAWEVTGFTTTILGVTGYRIVLNQGVLYAKPWQKDLSTRSSDDPYSQKREYGKSYKVATRSRYLYKGRIRGDAAQPSANGRYNDYFSLSETKAIVKDLIKGLTRKGLDGINFPRDWSNVDQDRDAFSGD